jgi:membrane protease YdiL (CAAX protease family)
MVHFSKNSVISTLAKKKSHSDSFSKDVGLSKKSLWFSVIIILFLRTGSLLILQGFLSIFFAIRGGTAPWNSASPWWSVYGTIVDIICVFFLVKALKREKISWKKFIGDVKWRWGHDLWLGLCLFLLSFPLIVVATIFASRWVLSSKSPILYPGLLMARSLPMWALLYSTFIWWLIWAPTEEATYQGYALIRLVNLTGKNWIAIVVVVLVWSLQHSFLPFIMDWHYVLWRICSFLPGIAVFSLLYLKVRRLTPFIVAHWLMDFIAVITTLKL